MNISKLVISVSLCFLVAFAGSAVTLFSISTWYAQLNKPIFSPPNFVFGPVWTVLYFLMGISLYLVWNRGLKDKKVAKAIKIFFVQLFLNFLWSLIFFGFHLPVLALITILILWISIFKTIKSFYKISKPASYLLLPYIYWVGFTVLLNLFVILLN